MSSPINSSSSTINLGKRGRVEQCVDPKELRDAICSGNVDGLRQLLGDSRYAIVNGKYGGKSLLHLAVESERAPELLEILLTQNAIEVNEPDHEGRTPLHLAVKLGKIEAAIQLVKANADLRLHDANGRTPLHLAVELGNRDLMWALIQSNKASIDMADKNGRTPLHLAVELGNRTLIAILIQEKANPNRQDEMGKTPLHRAVELGHQDIVSALSQSKGAELDLRDQEQTTPLHLAVKFGYPNIVSILIAQKADLNRVNGDRKTPLHLAIESENSQIAWALIDAAGIDLNTQDRLNQTALYLAIGRRKNEIARGLLDRGADTQRSAKGGKTPLHLAVKYGNEEMVLLLIQRGVNRNARDEEGKTPLHLALEHENEKIATLLIEQRVDLTVQDEEGKTPLHLALEQENLRIAEILIQAGADSTVQDKEGVIPLHLAVKAGYQELVEMLIEKKEIPVDFQNGFGQTAFSLALKHGHLSMARMLLEKGANLTISDRWKQTPLHNAVEFGDVAMVRSLFFFSLSLNVDVENSEELTPLEIAVRSGNLEMVNLLIEHGANIRRPCRSRTTLLHKAVRSRNADMVEMLVKNYGMDVNSILENTPLQEAIKSAHVFDGRIAPELIKEMHEKSVAVMRKLIQLGANLHLQGDKEPLTGLHLAAYYGAHKMIQPLIEMGADVNALDAEGKTPLYRAASSYQGSETCSKEVLISMIQDLVRAGADVNWQDSRGETALHQIARGYIPGDTEQAIDKLLKAGARVDQRNKEESTPLHIAASQFHGETVRKLLQHRADANAQDQNGNTPFHHLITYYADRGANENSDTEAERSDPEFELPTQSSAGRKLERERQMLRCMTTDLINAGADISLANRAGKTIFSQLTGRTLNDDKNYVAQLRKEISDRLRKIVTQETKPWLIRDLGILVADFVLPAKGKKKAPVENTETPHPE